MAQVLFDADRVPVAPGESATLGLRIHNDSPIVQEIRLEVLGVAAPWARLEPATVNVYPNATTDVSLILSPPEQTPLAGDLPIAVRATSAVTGEMTVEEATVELAASGAIQIELTPRTVRHRRRSKHRLEITNFGNAAATVHISASEPDEVLELDVHPTRLVIGPGLAEEVHIEARSVVSASGGSGRKPFTVLVEHDGTSQSTEGILDQVGGRPKWLVPAMVGMAAVLVAGFLLLNRGTPDGSLTAAQIAAEKATSTTVAGVATPGAPAGTPGASPDPGATSAGGPAATPSGPAAAATPGAAPAATPGATAAPGAAAASGPSAVAGVKPTTAGTSAPVAAAALSPSMFAAMTFDGTLAKGTGGTKITTVSTKVHDVTFPADINRCGLVASPGSTIDSYTYSPSAFGVAVLSPRVVRVTSSAAADPPEAERAGKALSFYLTAYCKDTTFAVVDSSGKLSRGQGAAASTSLGAGRTKVTFGKDVSQCAYVASTDNALSAYVGSVAGDPKSVLVETRVGSSGAGTSAAGFHLAIACAGGQAQYLVRKASGGYSPGSAVRSSPGVTYNDSYGYSIDVGFTRDLSACSQNINAGAAGTEAPPTEGYGSSNKGSSGSVAHIEIKNGGGGVGGGTVIGFHMVVLCP